MSSRKINYNLRPTKAIERKLILEVIKEVCTLNNSNKYQYIGFGAVYFNDFKLFHRELNITDMTSIENKGGTDLDRCKFNKPFKCVKIIHGHSNNVLPKLKWNKKSIVWLDYDGNFDKKVLSDIEICSKKLTGKCFLIITTRKMINFNTISDFENEFGDDTPEDISRLDLESINHSKLVRRVILNKIQSTILAHYANTEESERIEFKQLFNFTYKDGAAMYTIGGMFYKKSDYKDLNSFHFMKSEYVSDDEKEYNIDFPLITNKEIHMMNRYLPNSKDKFLTKSTIKFIPEKHRKNYYNVYKHFPTYVEISNL